MKTRSVAKVFGLGSLLTLLLVSAFWFGSFPASAANASLSLSPSSQTLAVGDTLTLEVRLDTGGNAVSSVAAFLNFDTARLQFDSIDSSTSAFDVKAEELLSGSQVRISRGKIPPAVNSPSALVAKVNFKALSSGTAPVSFALTSPGSGPSRVIKNDGLGTDILGSVSNGSYTISGSSTAAPTLTLSASPTSINSGQSSTLTWSGSNATSCTASGGWSGSKATSGSQSVSPTTNTTYTLSCTGAGGSVNKSATVTVTQASSSGTASLSLSPSSQTLAVNGNLTVEVRLNTGGNEVSAVSSYLNFDTARLQFVSADYTGSAFDVQAEESVSGNLIKITRGKIPPGINSSNALVAKVNFKALSSGTAAVSFALTSPGSGPSRVIKNDGLGTDILGAVTNGSYTISGGSSPAPTLTLSASPTSINSGQSSTLTWSGSNATSCTASGGWSGSKATSGSQSVSPTTNTTYTLSCTGAGGSVNKSATVTVTAATSGGTLDIAICDPVLGEKPFSLTIDNPFLPFPVGMVNVLEGGGLKVQVSVLNQTEVVAGVTTRVVEEREWQNGSLIEISRNFFVQTSGGTVCYYGEDVDMYSNGVIVGHGGAWRAGVGANKAGIMMPANPTVGMTYQMEIAPGVAEETAVITSAGVTLVTPARTFTDTLYIVETGPSYKYYARGVGMIYDDGIKLTSTTFSSTSPSAPTLTLSASPTSINSGQSSTLTWSGSNATSCTASGGWSGSKATSGSQSVSPTTNTTYTLSCSGSGGSVNKSATVTVSGSAGTLGSASLSLSPSSQTLAVNGNLTLEVRLNTGGQAVTAVSSFLNFDTARLEFVSVDSSTSAFSVKAEEILSGGQVKISRGQATPGVNSASALVAKVNFKALSSGTAAVSFALTSPGSGPSRVIKNDGLGTDILGAVTDGSYSITVTSGTADTTAPTVSITAPAVNATVSATTIVSATASDNVGVVGVQFKLDNVNLGSEDTSSPYDISWNTTQASNGTHTLTAVARDVAGNTASSAAVNINVVNTTTLTTAVTIADDLFTPKQLTVTAGTTVVWTNTGARPHTVTADNGSFDSGTLSPGATFSRQFNTPGTYPYYCIFHGGPGGVGQSGTVTVTSTASTTATASLSLSPSTQTLKVNDNFTVDIRLNTGGQAVTAVAFNLNFDNSKLQVLAVDSSSSAFDVTAEEVISSNVIKISRGQAAPGISSGNALVARITFKAIASGTANVNFSLTTPGSGPSRVIKNDGLGTDILGSVTNGSYTITAAPAGGGGGGGGGGGVSVAPARQGALIKYHNNPTVYLVENGLKRPIPSYEIYLAHYKERPIALIPDSQSYPTGSPVKFGPGALLKSRNSPTVYLVIDNSTKYGFRSAEEFHRFGYRFEQVREIAESELASYPDAGLASLSYHATGNFIKYPNNPTVYKIEHNTKRGIPSLAVFLSHADLSQILVVSTSFQYADGPILGFAEGTLIKGSGPTVYLIENQKRRGFRSAQSFLDLGYSFSQVRVVSDTDLALHQEGEPF